MAMQFEIGPIPRRSSYTPYQDKTSRPYRPYEGCRAEQAVIISDKTRAIA
jgi:hypothetical protein